MLRFIVRVVDTRHYCGFHLPLDRTHTQVYRAQPGQGLALISSDAALQDCTVLADKWSPVTRLSNAAICLGFFS